jgi:hypothetical protein
MTPIQALRGWRKGRYSIVASSATAKSEWDNFVRKFPKAMRAAYERLGEFPLEAYGSRQFPLKGKRNKPFWEYEITDGNRLYYAVDLRLQIIYVGVLETTKSESIVGRARDRRHIFDEIPDEQHVSVPRRVPKKQ